MPKNSRNPFPVSVHRSKTSFMLKLACDRSRVFRALRRLHAFPLCFMAFMIGCIKYWLETVAYSADFTDAQNTLRNTSSLFLPLKFSPDQQVQNESDDQRQQIIKQKQGYWITLFGPFWVPVFFAGFVFVIVVEVQHIRNNRHEAYNPDEECHENSGDELHLSEQASVTIRWRIKSFFTLYQLVRWW